MLLDLAHCDYEVLNFALTLADTEKRVCTLCTDSITLRSVGGILPHRATNLFTDGLGVHNDINRVVLSESETTSEWIKLTNYVMYVQLPSSC